MSLPHAQQHNTYCTSEFSMKPTNKQTTCMGCTQKEIYKGMLHLYLLLKHIVQQNKD